ncbi:MAG: MinD/ParA family protein [Desulfobacula sp.]|nr:MinD/ParA family protein [Desulfobacula sp.]
MARIITITSGKGGVGKTSISLNLSLSLASKGHKVCLFDADLGLANVNILTGIYPKHDLESVISGQFNLNEIIIKDFQGIDIIPGSSGVEKIADLTKTQTGTLISAFLDLEEYDYFIFDTSAGISSQVLSFCMASHEIILIATCEPTSLTDAYSMLKVLSKYGYNNPVKIVINQVKSGKAAQKAYIQLKDTVNKFLSIKVQPLGIMASDKNVRAAVISQTPFFMLFPDTIASKCIKSISNRLIKSPSLYGDMPLELFWDKCLLFLEKHYKPQKKSVSSKKSEIKPGSKTDDTDKKKELNISQDVKKTLSRIESRLSFLTKEVGEIKQFLKKDKKTQALPEAEEISLDFESWLKKKS